MSANPPRTNPFADSNEATPLSSNANSRVPSPDRAPQRPGYGRVRFASGEALDEVNNRFHVALRDASSPAHSHGDGQITFTPTVVASPHPRDSPSPELQMPSPHRPSPLKLPGARTYSFEDEDEENEKQFGTHGSTKEGLQRYGGSFSVPGSASNSPILRGMEEGTIGVSDIPLLNLGSSGVDINDDGLNRRKTGTEEAHHLVRQHTRKGGIFASRKVPKSEQSSRASSPVGHDLEDYVRKPEFFRGGVLGGLLSLYQNSEQPHHDPYGLPGHPHQTHSRSASGVSLGGGQSGKTTPKWYTKSANTSTTSLLVASGAQMMAPATGTTTPKMSRPKIKHRPNSFGSPGGVLKEKFGMRKSHALENEIKITIHIADIIARQKYILKMCRCLMLYGAPTHRLEEALQMSARRLQIDAQFLYIPGCMLISFGDPSTHTSEMHIVRTSQGVDLSKLEDIHMIYKEVNHEKMAVQEGTQELDTILRNQPRYGKWLLVLLYGLASAMVGPFGFKARLIDMPMLFLLGCLLGFLQLILAPRSTVYSNVFEISAAIVTSFLARAFGSIRGGDLFCFSAFAQASIALILPGYTILCGSLELQSKNIVAGSVRMFYAIIYSLFLGFGITIGSALYALIDPSATSATTCQDPILWKYNFIFVAAFAMCLAVINQARIRQLPIMTGIALVGYTVNWFASQRFASQPEIATGLGAFAIGVCGNLYSRLFRGLAFAAMLPSIFVLVPGGLAAQGSLMSGIKNADALAKNVQETTDADSMVFELGYRMVQVAIGITVGLFMSAIVVYPIGKKKSSLFSF